MKLKNINLPFFRYRVTGSGQFAQPLKALGVTQRMQDQEPAAKPGLSSAAQGIYVLSAKIN